MDCSNHLERFHLLLNLLGFSRSHCLIDMVISVKETTVLSVFHPDAQDLYNTCSDMKKVAWTLYDPNFRLNPDVCLLICSVSCQCSRILFRKKPYNYFMRSPQCYARDRRRPSNLLSKRWMAWNSSSKRSWMARGCNFINVEMSISTARGSS